MRATVFPISSVPILNSVTEPFVVEPFFFTSYMNTINVRGHVRSTRCLSTVLLDEIESVIRKFKLRLWHDLWMPITYSLQVAFRCTRDGPKMSGLSHCSESNQYLSESAFFPSTHFLTTPHKYGIAVWERYTGLGATLETSSSDISACIYTTIIILTWSTVQNSA